MKHVDIELHLSSKRTRKREFLYEMNRVVPRAALVELISPYYPPGQLGRRPFALESMLRIHFMQQWFGLSDPALEEALFDVPLYREFAQLDSWVSRLPDESTILRFRHRLEKHKLAARILVVVNEVLQGKGLLLKANTDVDATLIIAPSSTKNAKGERDPAMHQTLKGQQWYFGMRAHIGVDADSGLVHTVRGTAANVNDVTQGNSLLHVQETDGFGDAGYQGIAKRPDAKPDVNWHVAMRYGKRKTLNKDDPQDPLTDEIERIKGGIRAKVEHPVPVLKCQLGYVKVRYRWLKKNTDQITTLFALSNLWMPRHKLMMGRA